MNLTRHRRRILRQQVTNGIAHAWARALTSVAPRSVYVVDLRGLDPNAVEAHLRRCCAPALCCSDNIANALRWQHAA